MHARPPNINSLFFPKIFISTDFFLSLHSVLSLRFSFLSSHHLKPPATTRRDPRLFSQIWTHRGQPPPRRDPRRGSLLRSVTTEATPWSTDHHSVKHGSPRHETQTTMSRSTKHLAVPIPTVWRWWSLPISTVVFGCSDLRWFLVPISTAVSYFWCKTTIQKSKKYNI